MKNKKFYITTTIPYANAPPHIGFALEIVQADVLARWHSLLGEDVFFLTGTDEHGVKNYKMAKEVGLTPQQFVDKNSDYFRELTKVLNISNNYFIRTTDKKAHWPGVINLWKILAKKRDIYKKKYKGNYCYGCERFVIEKDLIDGKCPNHPNLTPELIEEENYFFKLSKYSDKIINLIKKDKLKITPEKWKNDFLSLIKDGLTDVSFSRDKKHLPWGIPVPGDENQVLYVWPDALTNYITGIGYPDKKYKKYWPADVHVVGKDMLRFHTGIWPGMLLSAGIKLPKEVIVHGFLTVNGQKMSKSLGNVVNPIELRKKYDADSIRYILMRTIPFGDDGDFSEKALVERNNSELADKLGNLVSRVSALAEKYGLVKTENKLVKKLKVKEISSLIENYELDKALNLIFEFVDSCNLYVQENELWKSGDKKKLYELADSIKALAILLWAFIPETCEKISKVFNFKIDFKELKKPLKIGKIRKAEILFRKIEVDEKQEEKVNKAEKIEKIEGIATMSEIVQYGDWEKLDLRVGKIIKVEDIENADKLYKLTIDIGKEKRVVCAGLKKFYSKDELKNKKCILFVNLASRMMRGIESRGMILAAVNEDESKVRLIQPDSEIELGARVR
ncbi:MAG: methionine--tRNA ligase [Candidatus Pacearchaeota archaeon]|nr:methionine--tRNA ligase [Candidatus Pacearchaeota archaeon]